MTYRLILQRSGVRLVVAPCIGSVSSKYWIFKWGVLYSARLGRLTPCRPERAGTAVRFQREVTMESTLTGPIFYLLIVWGVVTGVTIRYF